MSLELKILAVDLAFIYYVWINPVMCDNYRSLRHSCLANERSKNRERRQTGVVNFRIVRKCCGNSELFKDDIEEATRSPSTGSERVDNVVKVVSTVQAKYGWLRVVGNGHHTVCDITKVIQKSMSQIKQNKLTSQFLVCVS